MQLAYDATWIEEVVINELGDFSHAVHAQKRFSTQKEAAKYAEEMAAKGEAPYWHRVEEYMYEEEYADWCNTGLYLESGEFVSAD